MKKIISRISILMVVILNFINTTIVKASVWTDAKNWLSQGAQGGALTQNLQNANTEISSLAGRLFGVGLGIAFIVISALGISYFFAASSEAKSEIKQKSIVVLIGTVLLLGALVIWRVIVGGLSSGT